MDLKTYKIVLLYLHKSEKSKTWLVRASEVFCWRCDNIYSNDNITLFDGTVSQPFHNNFVVLSLRLTEEPGLPTVLGIWTIFFGFEFGSWFSDQYGFGFGSFRLRIWIRMCLDSDSDLSKN